MTSGAPARSRSPVVIRLRLLPEGGPTPRALGASALVHVLVLLALALLGRPRGLELPPVTTVRFVSDSELRGMAAPQRRTAPPPRPRGPIVATPSTPPRVPVTEAQGIAPPKPRAKPAPPKPLPERDEPLPLPSPTQPEEAPPGPEAGSAVEGADLRASVEGGSPMGDEYLGRLVTRVSQHWLKPRTGLPGRSAIVYFEMARDGRILSSRLEQPSGNDVYDLAAQRALELSQPLPPLPPAYRGPMLKVHFEFIP